MCKLNHYFLIFLLVMNASTFYAQKEHLKLPIDSLTNKITYTEVVRIDSLVKKNEIYSAVREWYVKYYKSSNNVIQMEDRENGKILGKALMQVYTKGLFDELYPAGYINYIISIYIKDGRYKYEITDFNHTGPLVKGAVDYGVCEKMINNKRFYVYFLEQMNINIKELTTDLKDTMSKMTVNNKKDNW